MKQNEEAKTQRNVAQYFKKYEDTFGPSEDLQNKEFWPQLSLPLQAELYWRSLEVLKADKFSGLLEYLAKTLRSASRSLIIRRNNLSILQHLFPSFPFILVRKPITKSRFQSNGKVYLVTGNFFQGQYKHMYHTKQPIVYFFLGKGNNMNRLVHKGKIDQRFKRQLIVIPCGRVEMHRREKPKNFCFG